MRAVGGGSIVMTKTIAAGFGEYGIRYNAVCPGFIMTDMHAAENQSLAGVFSGLLDLK